MVFNDHEDDTNDLDEAFDDTSSDDEVASDTKGDEEDEGVPMGDDEEDEEDAAPDLPFGDEDDDL